MPGAGVMTPPGVDWAAPWMAAFSDLQPLLAAQPESATAEVLNVPGLAPVRFVPQSKLPPGKAYEQFIFETGEVPTRDNLHDFFNGLCWMRFPLTKARLNQLQAAEISASGVAPLRGPVRDALTVFDENAAFLFAPEAIWDALAARQWRRLFVELRPQWHDSRLVLFGHALLEKLASPRKAITAHVYRANVPGGTLAELDAWVACGLSAAVLGAKPFLPLPVLGVPGWFPENENFSFYDDSLVFRPARHDNT